MKSALNLFVMDPRDKLTFDIESNGLAASPAHPVGRLAHVDPAPLPADLLQDQAVVGHYHPASLVVGHRLALVE